ncbi:unnamed protein product [Phytophthora lilii]|uniref:Unnamed protein product n=1 Tax=Phytophthora lilii TaxID=2077276 RepID=A0A9W6TUN4_9STRA|nr:unnamed protein product [Phytophthora lilii]
MRLRSRQVPMPLARRALFYQNDHLASDDLNAAYTLAQEAYRGNVSAAMCSNGYAGVLSKYQAYLYLAGKVVPHKSPENDGFVEYQACTLGLDESLFGTSYKDKFYKPQLNHADTGFITGGGYFKDSQKPIKWFECLL